VLHSLRTLRLAAKAETTEVSCISGFVGRAQLRVWRRARRRHRRSGRGQPHFVIASEAKQSITSVCLSWIATACGLAMTSQSCYRDCRVDSPSAETNNVPAAANHISSLRAQRSNPWRPYTWPDPAL